MGAVEAMKVQERGREDRRGGRKALCWQKRKEQSDNHERGGDSPANKAQVHSKKPKKRESGQKLCKIEGQ